jgi:predicted MFS family arabinose efflux permease
MTLFNNNTSTAKKGNISRQKYLWIIGIFTFIGVAGGYAYYALIGCNLEGGCAIKSNPYLMMLWGGAMGYLIPDMFLTPRNEDQPDEEQIGDTSA